MDSAAVKRYARLLVRHGVNIQKKQILVITSPIECSDFVRELSEIAFEEGARDVVVNWRDDLFSRIRYLKGADEIFDEFPDWKREFYLYYVRQGAAFLSISSSDPEVFKGVDPNRITRAVKASHEGQKEYRESLMSNKNSWCVASVPTKAWAKKVFPGKTEEEAVELLWEAILKSVRADREDTVKAWEEHRNNLKRRIDFLNRKRFRFLHYKNSLGTDLTIELPEEHIWLGGSDKTPEGIEFTANIPTEEVYTAPKKYGVNGRVVSSMPYNYNGNLIENFSFTFKDGKVVDFTAEKGYEILKNLLETDDGAGYLGEVALVPYDSPISNQKLLFYNTLFDENASCHLALGKAYPVCIRDGDKKDKEELEKLGINDSIVHEDFMVGTEDLEIIGETYSGEKIQVFKNGNFAIN